MASQYNVSDSSSEGSDIYGAAVSQAIEARSFYGRSLRQRHSGLVEVFSTVRYIAIFYYKHVDMMINIVI